MTESHSPATGASKPKPVRQTHGRYSLRLYIAGNAPRSLQAVVCIRKICDNYLSGRYDLEIIDIEQQPHLGEDEQIIVTPTLIRVLPLPLRRIIGDMTQTKRVLLGLNLSDPDPKDQPNADKG